MSQHAVVHFEIGGPDADALERFYGELFGWRIEGGDPSGYRLVHRMEGGVGGGVFESPDRTGVVLFYVTCGDDVAGVLGKAESLGATRAVDPMDVPGGPTIAAFKDPDGNLVGLVNGTPDMGSPADGAGMPVMWWEVGGADHRRTCGFYRDLFGWDMKIDEQAPYAEIASSGNGIGGGIGSGPQGPYVTVYVEAEDLSGVLARAESLGGSRLNEPMDVPNGPTIAHLGDPAGNVIGLVEKDSYSG